VKEDLFVSSLPVAVRWYLGRLRKLQPVTQYWHTIYTYLVLQPHPRTTLKPNSIPLETHTLYSGCLCQINNKHVLGIGKGKWRMSEVENSSLDKKQLIYNPTNISLPINLQTPETYTFQFFRHHKHTPTNLKFIP
jgi:hypothetical protein